jgi:hypothetical protein
MNLNILLHLRLDIGDERHQLKNDPRVTKANLVTRGSFFNCISVQGIQCQPKIGFWIIVSWGRTN